MKGSVQHPRLERRQKGAPLMCRQLLVLDAACACFPEFVRRSETEMDLEEDACASPPAFRPAGRVDSSPYSMLPTQQLRNKFNRGTEAERPVSSMPDSSVASTAPHRSVDSSSYSNAACACDNIYMYTETYICYVCTKKHWRPACSDASTILSCSPDSSRCAVAPRAVPKQCWG